MGEVNNIVCDYLGLPGYYADFWNGTVFRGKRKIKIWQLQRHDREYYKAKNKKGKTGNVRRDVQMRCKGKKDVLLGVELQLRFLEKGNWKVLFGAGACAGAAFLCRTPCGVVAFAAGAVLLFLHGITVPPPRRFKSLLPYAGGAGAVALLFTAYLTLVNAWSDYLRQCFTFIFGFVVKRGGSWSWTQFADSMIPLTGSEGFGNCIFALMPLLGIGAFFIMVRPLFYGRMEQLKKNLPRLAVVMLALGS